TNTYFEMTNKALELLEIEIGMSANIMTAQTTWDPCLRPPSAIRIVTGDVDAMEFGEIITGTDIPNTAHILAVVRNAKGLDTTDGYSAEIFIDQALTGGTHNSGPDTTISISSDTNTAHKYVPTSGTN